MSAFTPHISWSSDRTLRIALGDRDDDTTHRRVLATLQALSDARIRGITDLAAGYTTVQATLDLSVCDIDGVDALESQITEIVHSAATTAAATPSEPRAIDIPVLYNDECGPDLLETAALRGLTPRELIDLHSGATYTVRFLGFSPGFAYLSGLPPEIHAPRLATPRQRIPPGSVGIAGLQTGIYPHATPGGWRIIGRTPLRIFDPHRGETEGGASLLVPGDHMRFVPITHERFAALNVTWASCPSRGASPRGLAHSAGTSGEAPELGLEAQATLRILHPGHFTTIQDLGRAGHAAIGVPRSGAMDQLSLRLGNRLVGNPDSCAALEMTLFGCTLECHENSGAVVLALTGAAAAAVITRADGSMVEAPQARPFTLQPKERLKVAAMRDGARTYLCIAGGIDTPLVLGSRSTHVPSGIGGQPLRTNDLLPIGPPHGPAAPHHAAQSAAAFVYELRTRRTLALTPGPHAPLLGDALGKLNGATLTITNQADRSGVRAQLDAHTHLAAPPGNLLTEPMLPGGGFVQLPPGGEPIILGPDGPTTGGYAVIAAIAEASMCTLGQLRPGDNVRLEMTTTEHARTLAARHRQRLDALLPPIIAAEEQST